MRIDIAELDVGQQLRQSFNEVVDSHSDDVRFDVPVTGDVIVARTGTTVHLAGQITTTAPMVCGRCVATYRENLVVAVNEEFAIAGGARAVRGELEAEDFVLPLGLDLVLDVTEVVRQHLLLALPMVPVCRPDCRGLCPVCGTNLNDRQCHCGVGAVDPRLAPLRELRLDTHDTQED